ncbi:MAG: methyl-accepting chemotaxis protein [Clostridiaceae bacterium]|jgi:methyl-accepting chemotaxis protein|nr:methyl-accepting chemotaxis protein [Clostridiaceae bacterium]
MKSIGLRIVVSFSALILVVCLGLGITSYFVSSGALTDILNETMPKFAAEASITIEDSIQNQLDVLGLVASSETFRISQDDGYTHIVSVLDAETKRSGHRRMMLVDRNGRAISNTGEVLDMKDSPLFNIALSGEKGVSDPVYDDNGTDIVMAYAVPVTAGNEVSGVLIAVRDGLELSEFTRRIKFGETGEAFIINKYGRTIAHADTSLLLDIIENRATDADTGATRTISSASSDDTDAVTSATVEESLNGNDLGFENFTEVQRKMTEGETGFETYKYKGISKVAGFAPIPGYGWSIAVSVDRDEIMSSLSGLKWIILAISGVFLLVGFVVSYFIGKNISKPVVELTNQCLTMSEGDFTADLNEKYAGRHDEIGELTRGFKKINDNVAGIIKNVIREAERVDQANSVTGENMTKLTDQIGVMASITQDLSAKMEETSVMAEKMNATTTEIEAAIESIAVKAQKGAESAGEVSSRADELRRNAEESQKSAQDILQNNAENSGRQ